MIAPRTKSVSGRYLHRGAIAAAKGSPHDLRGFELPLEAALFNHRLYFSAVLEEVNNHELSGNIVFRRQGDPRLVLPFKVTMTGYGSTVANNVTRTDDLLVPSFYVTRAALTDSINTWQMGEQIGDDILHSGFYWNDGTNDWNYHVSMAPLYLSGNFDSVAWQPLEFYGTATGAFTLACVTMGVISDP